MPLETQAKAAESPNKEGEVDLGGEGVFITFLEELDVEDDAKVLFLRAYVACRFHVT